MAMGYLTTKTTIDNHFIFLKVTNFGPPFEYTVHDFFHFFGSFGTVLEKKGVQFTRTSVVKGKGGGGPYQTAKEVCMGSRY